MNFMFSYLYSFIITTIHGQPPPKIWKFCGPPNFPKFCGPLKSLKIYCANIVFGSRIQHNTLALRGRTKVCNYLCLIWNLVLLCLVPCAESRSERKIFTCIIFWQFSTIFSSVSVFSAACYYLCNIFTWKTIRKIFAGEYFLPFLTPIFHVWHEHFCGSPAIFSAGRTRRGGINA